MQNIRTHDDIPPPIPANVQDDDIPQIINMYSRSVIPSVTFLDPTTFHGENTLYDDYQFIDIQ